MPTVLDEKMIPQVTALVARYGRAYTFDVRSRTQSVDGRTTYGLELPATVKGSPPFSYDRRYIDGDVVRATDLQVILPAEDLAFVPTVGMRASFSTPPSGVSAQVADVDAAVVSVTPYYSGSLVCAWGIQLRS